MPSHCSCFQRMPLCIVSLQFEICCEAIFRVGSEAIGYISLSVYCSLLMLHGDLANVESPRDESEGDLERRVMGGMHIKFFTIINGNRQN